MQLQTSISLAERKPSVQLLIDCALLPLVLFVLEQLDGPVPAGTSFNVICTLPDVAHVWPFYYSVNDLGSWEVFLPLASVQLLQALRKSSADLALSHESLHNPSSSKVEPLSSLDLAFDGLVGALDVLPPS